MLFRDIMMMFADHIRALSYYFGLAANFMSVSIGTVYLFIYFLIIP